MQCTGSSHTTVASKNKNLFDHFQTRWSYFLLIFDYIDCEILPSQTGLGQNVADESVPSIIENANTYLSLHKFTI